jgi:uracil-DNA glycosylase
MIKTKTEESFEFLPFQIPPSWARVLQKECKKPYLLHLKAFLEKESLAGRSVFPPEQEIFKALQLTPFEEVKVVIVGQDPYHGIGQAHGLSFSVPKGVGIPPSLENIYKEMKSDLGIDQPNHGCLQSWAKQGVLLLNATLTVRKGEPLSHHKKGWELFTDAIIEALAMHKKHIVFLLWGKNAQEKCHRFLPLLKENHLVLMSPHPSPFSARTGFFGCRHFSKTNEYLQKHSLPPINWQIPESSG